MVKNHVTLIQEMNGQWEVLLSINRLCFKLVTVLTTTHSTVMPHDRDSQKRSRYLDCKTSVGHM